MEVLKKLSIHTFTYDKVKSNFIHKKKTFVYAHCAFTLSTPHILPRKEEKKHE